MRKLILASVLLASTAACSTTPAQLASTPVPAVIVQNAGTALKAYGIAAGVAQTALASTDLPAATKATITADLARGQAILAAGVTEVTTANTLGAVTADLLLVAAAYVHALPNG